MHVTIELVQDLILFFETIGLYRQTETPALRAWDAEERSNLERVLNSGYLVMRVEACEIGPTAQEGKLVALLSGQGKVAGYPVCLTFSPPSYYMGDWVIPTNPKERRMVLTQLVKDIECAKGQYLHSQLTC